MSTRTIAPAAALLVLAACSPKFDGPEKVKGLRVLAVQAEPPELGAAADGSGPGWPAAAATLRSLVGAPRLRDGDDDRPRRWCSTSACTPTRGDLLRHRLHPALRARPAGGAPAARASPTGRRPAAPPAWATAGAITFSGLEACSRERLRAALGPARPGRPRRR